MTDAPTDATKKITTLRPKPKTSIEKGLKKSSIEIAEPPQESPMSPPPTTPPTPPLTLTKTNQPNYLLRTTGSEVVDRRKVAWLLKSGKVSDTPYNPASFKNPAFAKMMKDAKINSPLNHLQAFYR